MRAIGPTELLIARRERLRDACIQDQLGLRYVGLHYTSTDFPAIPRQMYLSVNGHHYVKHGQGDYRRLDWLGQLTK